MLLLPLAYDSRSEARVLGALAPMAAPYWLGAKAIGPSKSVLAAGWSSYTNTLVKVMLPALLTTPVMVATPPGTTGIAGQFFTTKSRGEFVPGHDFVSLSATSWPAETLRALAANVDRKSTRLNSSHRT